MSFYRIINILDNLKNLLTKFTQHLLNIENVLLQEKASDILLNRVFLAIYEPQELLTILRIKIYI